MHCHFTTCSECPSSQEEIVPNGVGDMDQDAPSQKEPETLVRVDDLWFAPDTIVIRAKNKIFRVSGGILAARSSVFRDMITFPQLEDSDIERIDGFPVVRLYDPAEDVEVFLRVVYDSGYFLPAPAPFPLSAVLAALRLTHKYDVPYLRRRALDHLAVDGWCRTAYDEPTKDHLIYNNPQYSPVHAFSVITTAVKVSAQWLLPYAYYCAATYSGTESLSLSEGEMVPHVLKVLAGQAHLFRATIAIRRSFQIFDECGLDSCNHAARSALSECLDEFAAETWTNPIQGSLEKDTLKSLESLGMCLECREIGCARRPPPFGRSFRASLGSLHGRSYTPRSELPRVKMKGPRTTRTKK